jgi:hypothetical protein
MKIRPLLLLTAIVSSILGAVVVYLVLSVPNDLRADALLKEARGSIQDGDHPRAPMLPPQRASRSSLLPRKIATISLAQWVCCGARMSSRRNG